MLDINLLGLPLQRDLNLLIAVQMSASLTPAEAAPEALTARDKSVRQIARAKLPPLPKFRPKRFLCPLFSVEIKSAAIMMNCIFFFFFFSVESFEHWFLHDEFLIARHEKFGDGHYGCEKTADVRKPPRKIQLGPLSVGLFMAEVDRENEVVVLPVPALDLV